MYTIGIDLGTTNSCVSVFRNSKIEIIQDDNGVRTVPSEVCYADENIVVGNAVPIIAHKYPTNTIYESKRFIGQKYTNIKYLIPKFLYNVKERDNHPIISVNYNGEELNLKPDEISTIILKEMKRIAEIYLDEEIMNAVITVPAYFGVSQRRATILAAQNANFQKVNIINEPTAAALAYQHKNNCKEEKNVLVYDFGGGTFDVTIVNIGESHCTVLSTDGDCFLGGSDIDKLVQEYILNDMKKKYNVEKLTNRQLQRVKAMAIKCKKSLSMVDKFDIVLEGFLPDEDYELRFQRKMFEQLVESLLQKTLQIVKTCIDRAEISAEQIQDIVLVGGSTRIPKVEKILKDYFKKEKLNKNVNPDEDIAYGAGIYASILMENAKHIIFTDVLSISLGTDVAGDKLSVIIKRNTQLPCQSHKTYATTEDYQESMYISIYQGENETASNNDFLDELTIGGLTKERKGGVRVTIQFNLDIEGILTVTAFETNNRNKNKAMLTVDILN